MNEDLMIGYFLGQLPENESRRLEEESLRNEKLFEQLHSAEESLIDSYVRGEMSAERKKNFEQNYLNTERRRESVALAATLHKRYNKSATVVPSWKRWAWAAGIAAALVLGLLATWLMWRPYHSLPIRADGPQPSASPVQTQSPSPVLVGVPSPEPNEQVSPEPKTPTTQNYATFMLVPGNLRSSGGGQVVTVKSDVSTLRLQMTVRQNSYDEYSADLKTAEGVVVVSNQTLQLLSRTKPYGLQFDVAARRLESRQYILTLYGSRHSSPRESIADYVFKVKKS